MYGSGVKLLFIKGLKWVNKSKLCWPWYAPIPLLPIPPKGKLEFITWIILSLATIAPAEKLFLKSVIFLLLLEKIYAASGLL